MHRRSLYPQRQSQMPVPACNWCLDGVGIPLTARLSSSYHSGRTRFRIIIVHHIPYPRVPNLRWDVVPADPPITTAHGALPSPRPSGVGEAPNPVWLKFVGANTWAPFPNYSIHSHFQPFSSLFPRHSFSRPPTVLLVHCPKPPPPSTIHHQPPACIL